MIYIWEGLSTFDVFGDCVDLSAQVYHCQIYSRFVYHDSLSHASYVPVFINFCKECLISPSHSPSFFNVSRVYVNLTIKDLNPKEQQKAE